MSKEHSPRVCHHCMACSDVMDMCEVCCGTGEILCDSCGTMTGFSATVRTEAGEDLCRACADLWEMDAA